ncbi:hypothetical protein E4U42_004293 [Claviceps africana]|uniref:Uncharacterized protein n=1 Tax=Claviceps africana TaxID=83212 RepID=A0A8K0J5M1_9HYPO|nr:hypothetical protein E4U42_004293 [Claviceps africana]
MLFKSTLVLVLATVAAALAIDDTGDRFPYTWCASKVASGHHHTKCPKGHKPYFCFWHKVPKYNVERIAVSVSPAVFGHDGSVLCCAPHKDHDHHE